MDTQITLESELKQILESNMFPYQKRRALKEWAARRADIIKNRKNY